MRKSFSLILVAVLLGGCAPTATITGGGGDLGALRLEPYDGPKARIAVSAFEDKTAKGYASIGEGMATMFTTSLVSSNRYIVLERDLLDEVIKEQDLGASGRVKAGTEAPMGEIEGAELLLTGAITAFEPEKFGVGGGIIGLGTLIGTAILHSENSNIPIAAATYTESYIALDVRLVDSATSRILASISVEGRGVDWGGGVIGEVGGGRTRLPLGFGGFQKNATEKAVRTAINRAVAEIVRQTPPQFYHYADQAFDSGKMLAFGYIDIPGMTGEKFPTREVRTAASEAEWAPLAASLGVAPETLAGKVDFTAQQVVLIAAGSQDPGKSAGISVEKAVAFPDRIEISAAVAQVPLPKKEEGEEGKGAKMAAEKKEEKVIEKPLPQRPVTLLIMDRSAAPITVNWN